MKSAMTWDVSILHIIAPVKHKRLSSPHEPTVPPFKFVETSPSHDESFMFITLVEYALLTELTRVILGQLNYSKL